MTNQESFELVLNKLIDSEKQNDAFLGALNQKDSEIRLLQSTIGSLRVREKAKEEKAKEEKAKEEKVEEAKVLRCCVCKNVVTYGKQELARNFLYYMNGATVCLKCVRFLAKFLPNWEGYE